MVAFSLPIPFENIPLSLGFTGDDKGFGLNYACNSMPRDYNSWILSVLLLMVEQCQLNE